MVFVAEISTQLWRDYYVGVEREKFMSGVVLVRNFMFLRRGCWSLPQRLHHHLLVSIPLSGCRELNNVDKIESLCVITYFRKIVYGE